jgi:hypothetical protein
MVVEGSYIQRLQKVGSEGSEGSRLPGDEVEWSQTEPHLRKVLPLERRLESSRLMLIVVSQASGHRILEEESAQVR